MDFHTEVVHTVCGVLYPSSSVLCVAYKNCCWGHTHKQTNTLTCLTHYKYCS